MLASVALLASLAVAPETAVPVQRPKASPPAQPAQPPAAETPATPEPVPEPAPEPVPEPGTAPQPIPQPGEAPTTIPEPSTEVTHPDVPPPGTAPASPAGEPRPPEANPPEAYPPEQGRPVPPPRGPDPGVTMETYQPIRRPSPPNPGYGRLVGGSLMLAGGATLIGFGSYVAAASPNPLDGVLLIPGGIGVSVSGAMFVVSGSKARRNYLGWQNNVAPDAPRPGNGLLVGGIATTAGGIIVGVTGFFTYAPARYVLWGSGGAMVAGGGTMLGLGIRRRVRFDRWTRDIYMTAPVAGPIPGGAMASMSARF